MKNTPRMAFTALALLLCLNCGCLPFMGDKRADPARDAIPDFVGDDAVIEGWRWFDITLGGRKTGYTAMLREETIVDGAPAIRFEKITIIRAKRFGVEMAIRVVEECTTTIDYRPISIQETTIQPLSDIEVKRADFEDGLVQVSIEKGGSARSIVREIPGEIYAGPAIFEVLAGRGPTWGDRIEIPLFSFSEPFHHTRTVEVLGHEPWPLKDRTIEVCRLGLKMDGIASQVLIDGEGEICSIESSQVLDFRMTLTDKSEALAFESIGEILVETAVPVNIELPDPRQVTAMRSRLKGPGIAERIDMERTDFASVTPVGTDEVLIENRVLRIDELPRTRIPVNDQDLAPFLRATVNEQCDDPEIRRTALGVIDGNEDVLPALLRLNDWVHHRVANSCAVGYASAEHTIDSMIGDCTEHAVLLGALAKSVGIPTRCVFGIVYHEGRFYYHAWIEAWAGIWVPVDPAWGEAPADATHIALARLVNDEGSLQAAVTRLMPLIGKLEVEVISCTADGMEVSIGPGTREDPK
ncbi:transglutaminase family protein [Thermodesulfobacteriota bacterium]